MDDISDLGGVAARVGFKFQDHVAALFILQMIGDRRIAQVECETSDDITLKWRSGSSICPEYIQVKTTDKDSKWSPTEITARSDKKAPTSLIEKSLLSDQHEPNARFRIVARRGVGKPLLSLTDPIAKRDPSGPIAALAAKLKAKHPGTISENGNDLDYWTRNALWQVLPSVDHLLFTNLQSISRLAEDYGANPSHSHAMAIYRDLLRIVEEAASASRRDMSQKIVTRERALEWWSKHLAETRAAQNRTSKPYRVRGDGFFAEIHFIEDAALGRSATGYDVQYERKVWRSKQLARYMADWIPEVTLRASELVEIDQLNLRQKLEAGLKVIQAQRFLDVERLMGETLLHAVLRHWYGSEPIACKLFHQSPLGDRVVGNAHIVHTTSGDELWLGRARFFYGGTRDALLKATRLELAEALTTDLLSEEREIILQLREPQHLTANTLNEALERGAPVDELIKVLCLPLLIAYDSAVLEPGYSDDYKARLVDEIEDLYGSLKACFPPEVDEVRVHVFLIPVESISTLQADFKDVLGIT